MLNASPDSPAPKGAKYAHTAYIDPKATKPLKARQTDALPVPFGPDDPSQAGRVRPDAEGRFRGPDGRSQARPPGGAWSDKAAM